MDEVRLIDANKLMKELFKTSLWDNQDEDVFADLIEDQPTAYDTNKVVEQLGKEERRAVANYHSSRGFKVPEAYGQRIAFEKAIEIVKKGGTEQCL